MGVEGRRSMKEQVGKVTLNYTYYRGNDLYSDGDEIEEELLQIAQAGTWKEALTKSNKWPLLYHYSDIRENIIKWYPFMEDVDVLEIGSGCGAISGALCRKAKRVVGIELSKRRSMINAYRNQECCNLEIYVGNFSDIELSEKFDYITLIGVLEYAASYIKGDKPYEELLNRVKQILKPGGKIIIAIENKMGMKYLNGAKEDHVGVSFAGIEDYRKFPGIRTFSKAELENMLGRCGLKQFTFYYPMPDYKLPDSIYTDMRMPKCGEVRTWGTNYDTDRCALFNEAIMADQVCKDNMFGYFSNSFLVVCNEEKPQVVYAKYDVQKKPQYRRDKIVTRESIKTDSLNNALLNVTLDEELYELIHDINMLGEKIKELFCEMDVLFAGMIEAGYYVEVSFQDFVRQEEGIEYCGNTCLIDVAVSVDFLKYQCLYDFYQRYCMYFANRQGFEKILLIAGLNRENIDAFEEKRIEIQEYMQDSECNYLSNYKKACKTIVPA